jgi:hypothetical protein
MMDVLCCTPLRPLPPISRFLLNPCDTAQPNGPFYDPVHGMYHNFYQDHLAEPQTKLGPGRGPDWGHWVSRDFLHWCDTVAILCDSCILLRVLTRFCTANSP